MATSRIGVAVKLQTTTKHRMQWILKMEFNAVHTLNSHLFCIFFFVAFVHSIPILHCVHCSPFLLHFTFHSFVSHASRSLSLSRCRSVDCIFVLTANSVMWSKHKDFIFYFLTQHLTEYRSAILAMTSITGIKWICKLNKCISFVHWNSCWQIKTLLIVGVFRRAKSGNVQ